MARSRWRVRLITAILSPVIVFGVLEASLRIAGYRHVRDASLGTEEARWMLPRLYERHPVLRWTLKRNTVLHEPLLGFEHASTNSLGLRGRQPPKVRKPEELRVLCLGDSVTFGLGVRDEETWPAQLKQALLASPLLGGRPVHVLNGGVPGWSCVQGMRLLDEVQWYEPNVVVFWFGYNDVQPALGRPDAETGMLEHVASTLYQLRTVQLVASAVDAVRGGGDDATRASVEDYAAAVDRLKALEAGGGPQVVFVRCPERIDATITQLSKVIERAEGVGVKWVAGPMALMLSIAPAPEGVDLVGRVVSGPKGLEVRFSGVDELRKPVREVRDNVEYLRACKRGLAARSALLPADSLGAEELFRGADLAALFADNCHLSAQGCWAAAQAIAARILSRLPR